MTLTAPLRTHGPTLMPTPMPSAAPSPVDGAVVAVIGASGGCGASSFAAVLAVCRPGTIARSTLLDLDPSGGGIDLLLALDGQVGARWSDIRLGGGALDPAALRDRLPTLAGVGVLACDSGADPSGLDVEQVILAARRIGPVVLDVPRWLPATASSGLASADAAVVVVAADVRAIVSGVALLRRLEALSVRTIALLRPGVVPLPDVARALGASVDDVLPVSSWLGGDDTGRLDVGAVPQRVSELARRVWRQTEGGS